MVYLIKFHFHRLGLMMVGRLKYSRATSTWTQCFEIGIVSVERLGLIRQVLIKFGQRQFKRDVKRYVLKSISLFILFGIRKTCLSSEGHHDCTSL
jgi:hypothetical protein